MVRQKDEEKENKILFSCSLISDYGVKINFHTET